jgi:hypothetical protein
MASPDDSDVRIGSNGVGDDPHLPDNGPGDVDQKAAADVRGRVPGVDRQRGRPGKVLRPIPVEPVKVDIVERLFEKAKSKAVTPPDDEEIRLTCPFLWQLLTWDRYPNGMDRKLPELLIRRVDGGYVIELRDHETLQAKHAMALRLLDCISALEKSLADSSLPWRAFKSYQNKKGIERHEEKKA